MWWLVWKILYTMKCIRDNIEGKMHVLWIAFALGYYIPNEFDRSDLESSFAGLKSILRSIYD